MADELLKQIVEELHGLRKELSDFRSETKEHLDQYDKKLDRHEQKLNAVYEQVAKNSVDIAQIKTDQHALVVGQAKQDKILQMLATRSLEQEADIISLKKAK
ncbi:MULTISPECIES: hypothetical protein [unclassified Sporolactobacillus]|uniref:hypothetical protein n=1 Tax=unclassified Sporolactobacillus TaxID=2628533 RepID=UPI00236803BC|nr:hypothetical protein [Sporolactobacillus sp. CQH2019]MDD9147793.1 hypothetical protein [Sporolactobacillus sp. CQH2019]